jgi:hypothetical protein
MADFERLWADFGEARWVWMRLQMRGRLFCTGLTADGDAREADSVWGMRDQLRNR